MAAIIAQMTRANRERMKNKRIEISKCMYEIPPFPERFDPKVHNKYIKATNDLQGKREAVHFRQLIIDRLNENRKEEEMNQKFSLRTCIIEATIIIGTLSIVPSLSIIILLFWPDDVDNLFEDGNGG
ncbi:uncharacterized protein [Lepeophtheirus salmonis]|uniref:Uncharacterized protein n=1 Tax=Lepeophtheirus salmonis TaxID=72036 RepID=A0A0K2TJ63_LEPSM|nr:uncharacterized protein LOC121118174 isoform X2 [Lepeophtheirus salmonis]